MDCPPRRKSGGCREAVAIVEKWRFDCSQFQYMLSRVNKTLKILVFPMDSQPLQLQIHCQNKIIKPTKLAVIQCVPMYFRTFHQIALKHL